MKFREKTKQFRFFLHCERIIIFPYKERPFSEDRSCGTYFLTRNPTNTIRSYGYWSLKEMKPKWFREISFKEAKELAPNFPSLRNLK